MRILAMLLVLSFVLMGCETVHEGAKTVGKPIGEGAKVVGSVSDGALETYGDKETDNPYNR